MNGATGVRRTGCLGCLLRVGVALLFGLGVLALVTILLAPWGFYLGGRFHPLAYWQGWGRLHSNVARGDYVLYVRIEPSFHGGSRMYAASELQGVGYLCTPHGERFYLHLGGDMRAHLKLSTDGEAIRLWMNNWSAKSQFSGNHRPSIELRGQWHNPDLVLDDKGSISNAFNSDGTVYDGHSKGHPYNREILPVTLHEGPYSEFQSACAAQHR